MHILICILWTFLCVCYCKSRCSQGLIKYVNMHYLFLIVIAPWPSNDVMAMHGPQAHFWCLQLVFTISFLAFFFLGILVSLHNPLWTISFACTTTWRDFSILQAITTLTLTIDISIDICIWVIPARCRTSTSFANYATAVKTLTLRQVFILTHWNSSISL